ncbi:MAG: BamA/TamA family outer membrane protein [Bryobacteraceae bacterium]|nr:BamA/TamA family outer membrane protein [Bryobacteraceae bacterium]
MKLLCLSSLLIVAIPLLGQSPVADPPTPSAVDEAAAPANVNCRYKVESVEVPRTISKRLSRSLKRDLENLVGQNFDPRSVDSLASRIRREVHVIVAHRVEKGQQPEHVKVVYEPRERGWEEEDARVTQLAYHTKQGTTVGFQAGFDVSRNNRVEAGVFSDADTMLGRVAGYNLAWNHRFGERVRLRFEFEGLHQQWNVATESALLARNDVPGIYRDSYRMDPGIVIMLAPGLSLTTGLSFQQFQTQFPAARYEASNAVTTTLRHRRRWGNDSSAGHEWNAGYTLRAATSLLDSDFAYVRHDLAARYSFRQGASVLTVRALGGVVGDEAPLFERFTLGDSRTLRGWNKFDVAPLGGTRMAYASLQYTWHRCGAFYDTGSVWDRRTPARLRQSAGVMVALDKEQDGPYVAVGFPVRSAGFAPVFVIGMNF